MGLTAQLKSRHAMSPRYTAVPCRWDFSVLRTLSMIRRGAGETRQIFFGQRLSVFK
jgi:hypothetical protein